MEKETTQKGKVNGDEIDVNQVDNQPEKSDNISFENPASFGDIIQERNSSFDEQFVGGMGN